MHKQRMREENFQTEGSSRAFSWGKVRWMAALAAALCVVAMFVCGATLLAVPGTLEQITIQSPLLGTHVFDVNPWY